MKGFVLMVNDNPVFCEITEHAEPTQAQLAKDDHISSSNLTRIRGNLYVDEASNCRFYIHITPVNCPQEGP